MRACLPDGLFQGSHLGVHNHRWTNRQRSIPILGPHVAALSFAASTCNCTPLRCQASCDAFEEALEIHQSRRRATQLFWDKDCALPLAILQFEAPHPSQFLVTSASRSRNPSHLNLTHCSCILSVNADDVGPLPPHSVLPVHGQSFIVARAWN